jgi:uncharacterized protein YciI
MQRLPDHYVYRLIPPRPTFDQDMSVDERAVMDEHVVYWGGLLEAGRVVVYGPVRDATGAWGLGVLRAESPDAALEMVLGDPAISSGMGSYEFGAMPVAVLPE